MELLSQRVSCQIFFRKQLFYWTFLFVFVSAAQDRELILLLLHTWPPSPAVLCPGVPEAVFAPQLKGPFTAVPPPSAGGIMYPQGQCHGWGWSCLEGPPSWFRALLSLC